jgi:hypothetical protein
MKLEERYCVMNASLSNRVRIMKTFIYKTIAHITFSLACVSSLTFSNAAIAGRSCETNKTATPQMVQRSLTLAERTMNMLNTEFQSNGTQVVVLARAGQDLSRYGLQYSHLGFAHRNAQGQWLVTHKLNICGTADAYLYRQGLGEFFLDDLYRYEAAWVIPTQEIQSKLKAVLEDRSRVASLNHRAYNMVSYPWSQRYQQSNQWAIETLAAAVEPGILSRQQAQSWLQYKGYQPSTLNINAFTRLGGRITSANVAFDDHPSEKRFADRIETVTVDSVFSWLQRSGMSTKPRGVAF